MIRDQIGKFAIFLFASLIGLLAAVLGFNAFEPFTDRLHLDILNPNADSKLIQEYSSKSENDQALGHSVSLEGDVQVRGTNGTLFVPLEPSRSIFSQDQIVTGNKSNITFRLKNSTLVKLFDNTRVIFERDPERNDGLILTLLDGRVSLVESGNLSLLKVYRNGKEVSAKHLLLPFIDFRSANLRADKEDLDQDDKHLLVIPSGSNPGGASSIESNEPANGLATSDAFNAPLGGSETQLSNDDIFLRLQGQTRTFQRCYLNFIEREHTRTTGQVVIGFTVNSNGRVRDSKLIRSEFKDSTLHNCLTEVIERTRFQAFQGKDVVIGEFPILLQ